MAALLAFLLLDSTAAAELKEPPPEEPGWKAGVATAKITAEQPMWMAGYAGYDQEYLQADHPGLTALFIAGCGADQNPYPRRTVELAQRQGRSLATAVEAALFANPRPLRGALRCAMENIDLERADEAAEKRVKPIQVIHLGGDVTLVALASEVVVDYSLRLKRELGRPSAMPWVAAYRNGYFGYIPSARVLAEGGYESPAYALTIEAQILGKVHEMVRQRQQQAEAD